MFKFIYTILIGKYLYSLKVEQIRACIEGIPYSCCESVLKFLSHFWLRP
jgi:hypothetical protein